jgi:hypothetical protein
VGELRALGAKIVDVPWRDDTLDALKLARDFVATENGVAAMRLAWTHRCVGEADVYFVSNQQERARELELSLRVNGRTPEIWDPVTGEIVKARTWKIVEERTVLPMPLHAAESVFVVFREKTADTEANAVAFARGALSVEGGTRREGGTGVGGGVSRE